MKTLLNTAALSIAFLAPSAFAVELPTEKVVFQAMVAREVVLGSPIKEAENRLISMGLQCKWITRGWTNNVRNKTEFLFCSHQTGSIVQRRWIVSVLPRSGLVEELRSNVGLIGP